MSPGARMEKMEGHMGNRCNSRSAIPNTVNNLKGSFDPWEIGVQGHKVVHSINGLNRERANREVFLDNYV